MRDQVSTLKLKGSHTGYRDIPTPNKKVISKSINYACCSCIKKEKLLKRKNTGGSL